MTVSTQIGRQHTLFAPYNSLRGNQMSTDGPGYMRWTPDEYLKVAVQALQFIDKGVPVVQAFVKGQRVALHRSRHRPQDELLRINKTNKAHDAGLQKHVDRARALGPEKLAELVIVATTLPRAKPEKVIPPAEPKPMAAAMVEAASSDASVERKDRVNWTQRERSLLARWVQAKLANGDPRALSGIYLEAQGELLDPSRHRGKSGLYAANGSGLLKALHEDGLRHVWMLPKEEEPQAAEELSEPVTGSDAVDMGELLQRAGSATGHHIPPPPPPPKFGAFLEASKAFADTLAGALETLLNSQAQHLLSGVEARIANIAQEVGLSIAAQIERGLRQTVVDTMTAELGGPVAAPVVSAPVAPLEPPPVHSHHGPRLKVDVLGIPDNDAAIIKRAFNGNTDLRLMTTEHAHRWEPRSNCEVILNTRMLSHKVSDRVKSYGVKPHRLTGGPNVVIAAIEEMLRAQGVTV